MQKEKVEKQKINYDQIIGAALLYFGSIDYIDLDLFIRDLKKTNRYVLENNHNFEITKILKYNNGLITFENLQKNRDLIADNVPANLIKFFAKYNLYGYGKRKVTYLELCKGKAKENTNILVVSTNLQDAQDLQDFGFEHVDYVKSILTLNKIFKQNKHILDQYHVIVRGDQYLATIANFLEIQEHIDEQVDKDKLIKVTLQRRNGGKVALKLNKLNHIISVSNLTKEEFANKFTENIIYNNALDPKKEYKALKIKTQVYKFPTKKSDLKILVLSKDKVTNKLVNKNGLNVDFQFDNIPNLLNGLGNYDIIISSYKRKNIISQISAEIEEQCKNYNRPLALFLTYTDQDVRLAKFNRTILGKQVLFEYLWAGELGQNLNSTDKIWGQGNCDVLRKEWQQIGQNPVFQNSNAYASELEMLLKESVRIYNAGLMRSKVSPIESITFASPRTISLEFLTTQENIFNDDEVITIAEFDDFIAKLKAQKDFTQQITENTELSYQQSKDNLKLIYQDTNLNETWELRLTAKNYIHNFRQFCLSINNNPEEICTLIKKDKNYLFASAKQIEILKTIMSKFYEIKHCIPLKEDTSQSLISKYGVTIYEDKQRLLELEEKLKKLKSLKTWFTASEKEKIKNNKRKTEYKKQIAHHKQILMSTEQIIKEAATFNFTKFVNFLIELLTKINNKQYVKVNFHFLDSNINLTEIYQFTSQAKPITVITEKENENILNIQANQMLGYYPYFIIKVNKLKNIHLNETKSILIYNLNSGKISDDLVENYPELENYLLALINIRLHHPEFSEEEAYTKVMNKLLTNHQDTTQYKLK